MSKLALGLGYTLLGDAFLHGAYAQCLRNCTWEQDVEKRQNLGVHFYQEYHEIDSTMELFCIPGAHSVLLFPSSEGLHLIILPYGKHIFRILLSDMPDLYKPIVGEGQVYILCPEAEISIGPISLPDYVMHYHGYSSIDELDFLKSRRNDLSLLPPMK
jgi:hypothetical protein